MNIVRSINSNTLARYSIAIGSVVAAWLLREALAPLWVPNTLPFLCFFPAIVLAAWYGRMRLALLSIGLSTLLANYSLLEPREVLQLTSIAGVLALISFVLVALCIAGAIEAMHRANARERQAAKEARRVDELSAHLAAIVTSSSDAVVSKTLEGIVTSWNDAAQRMLGYGADEMIGQSIYRIVPPEKREEENQILARLRAGERVEHFETVRVCKDGSRLDVSLTISPIKNRAGEIIGASKVARDISERKRLDEALWRSEKAADEEREALLMREQELRLRAEEANRLKDEFLATMSHELRNPLNVILGYSELFLRSEEFKKSPQLARMGEALRRNALVQSRLIRDLLDLSRLRSGKLVLNTETVSVMTAVNNAVETVSAEAADKDIAIAIDAPDEVLFVEGDLLRLEQIVWNLLSNAVKFTPKGGKISVRARKENDHIILAVADTGQGIDTSFLPHVFEMFRQADASSTRAQSGMGIGLALVRQLVELHGGDVSVESAGRGHGASFTVRLPESDRVTGALPAVPDAAIPPLVKLGVLVLDDSKDTTEMLRCMLEQSGARVTTATSGAEALQFASERDFDVVLSDISMPGMDGFEFVRRLRELPGKKDLPVLALTGFGRPEDIQRAEIQGFFSHLTKPFDPKRLAEILQNLPGRGP